MQSTSDESPIPLTRHTRGGAPIERPATVEAQIREVLPLAWDALKARVDIADPQSPGFLREETLVYLIRAYHQRDDREVTNELAALLIRRTAGRTRWAVSTLPSDRRVDAFRDVVKQLFQRILDLSSDRGDFLQVRFSKVHKGIVLDVLRKHRRELRRTSEWSVDLGAAEDDPESYDNADGSEGLPASADAPIEDVVIAREALQSIPEPYRTVLILCDIEEWPIESNDPDVVTVSSYFGVTSRTIRSWHTKAKQALERWRREQP